MAPNSLWIANYPMLVLLLRLRLPQLDVASETKLDAFNVHHESRGGFFRHAVGKFCSRDHYVRQGVDDAARISCIFGFFYRSLKNFQLIGILIGCSLAECVLHGKSFTGVISQSVANILSRLRQASPFSSSVVECRHLPIQLGTAIAKRCNATHIISLNGGFASVLACYIPLKTSSNCPEQQPSRHGPLAKGFDART